MDRQNRLTKVFNDIIYGQRSLSNKATGIIFLEAITLQDPKVACVEKLVNVKNGTGLEALQKSLFFTADKTFLNGPAASLLKYIHDPTVKQIYGGQYLHDLLRAIVDPPIFWKTFVKAFLLDSLDSNAQLQFAWLLSELILLPGAGASPYLDTAKDPTILQRLLTSNDQDTRIIGEKIKHVLSSSVTVNTDGEEDYVPGGRHDNDFADFRQIAILPTADELRAKEKPFLRPASAIDDPETSDQRLGIYLDNQFRLLREDMLAEMRDELQIAQGFKKGRHRGVRLDDLTYSSLDFGHEGQDGKLPSKFRKPWGMRFVYQTGFGRLNNKAEVASRKKVLKDDRKFLPHNSFACLLFKNEVVAFPTISRNEELLVELPPKIVLRIGDSITNNTKLLHLLKSSGTPKFTMIQIDTAVFAYEPVLRRLQNIKELTLSQELLHWEPGQLIDAPPNLPDRIIQHLEEHGSEDLRKILKLSNSVILDRSQQQSLLMSLKQRVSLIQGPPGTGKSFIGALLTKILFDNTNSRILIATYTNHALDTFLEDLLKIGVPPSDIIRLGGNCSKAVEHLSLFNQARKGYDKEHFGKLRVAEEESMYLDDQIRKKMNEYMNFKLDKVKLMEFLEFEGPEYFQAFQVPESKDGMEVVGSKGKGVNKFYLLDKWINNDKPGKVISKAAYWESKAIWDMPSVKRKEVLDRWNYGLRKEFVDEIIELVQNYDKIQHELDKLWNGSHGKVIARKRIVACTTTGAAKYVEELHRAAPQVMLVEEAGEILESHIITALGKETKQLILIGDHKQLRPKVNNYGLTVEKGDGYDLNCSMFERLVRKGFPHQVLSQQHRMRPEISDLVRQLTYPDLKDAPKTFNRPDIRGFQDNVVFVTHEHKEDEHTKFRGGLNENSHKSSKQNTYEAEMVLKCVRYLGQQGYGTSDLVILTPYLGQLQLLREKLSKEMDPVLNDLDHHDLVQAGLMPASVAKLDRKPIRLATIDNYQGEEADIVVVSLTRSNAANDIGFLFSPERINVLLSRARNGLIMIGNALTFSKSKKGGELWTKIFNMLREGRHMYEGFPIVCQQHRDRKLCLSQPRMFDEKAPDGGCLEPCGVMLNCTIHKCPRLCHQLSDHSGMRCETIMTDVCPKGHQKTWKCFEIAALGCRQCDQEAKAAEEKKKRDFERQKKREAEAKENQEMIAKVQAELDEARAELQEEIVSTQRAAALIQKLKELEDVKKSKARKNAPPILKAPVPASPVLTSPLLANFGPNSSILNLPSPPRSSSPTPPSGMSGPPSGPPSGPSGPPSGPPGPPAGPPGPPAGPPSGPPSKPPSSTGGGSSRSPSPAPSNSGGNVSSPPNSMPTNPLDFQNPGPSPANVEWNRQKNIDGAVNPDIDALMDLIGLDEVKEQVLKIKAVVDVALRQGTDISEQRFGVSMLGNPGTGKTTVARLYAKILCSLGVLQSSVFIEATGSSLADDGVKGAKGIMAKLKTAKGGALFVDEAYQLADSRNHGGFQVLEYLLAEIENNRNCVFLFAGYSREMEKFFEANPGIPSRIPYKLDFADYKNYHLLEILKRKIRKRFNGRMKIHGGEDGLYMRVFIRRIAAMRGQHGFGNARAVENAFDRLVERQAVRLQRERKNGNYPDDLYLTKEDIIGLDPSKAIVASAEWKTLQNMIGLQSVKTSVSAMIDRIQTNYRRELQEKPPINISLNRVFLGSPGTGKTTVAKLYGAIMVDLGLLSNGEVIIKTPADFVGAHLGHSEQNTKKILDSTKGKVLVIDEFYGLYKGGGASGSGDHSDSFKTAVIDTIVAEVQSVPGEDRCVLLCGYRDQMQEMFDNVNPGLARRFAIEDAFEFENFTKSELGQILDLKLKAGSMSVTAEAHSVALDVLERYKARPNFGNGGEVENLLSRAKTNHQTRQSKLPINQRDIDIVFEAQDIDPQYDRSKKAGINIQQLFRDVIGHQTVVGKLEEYQRVYANLKAAGRDPKEHIPMNFIFKGPPGTGKTTTARKMGQVYYDMGMLGSAEVIECSATDFVGQYVGQTGPKTQKQLEKGLGKILFIDEAYRLIPSRGSFANEALDELVDALTKPKFARKMIIILAGYDQDMNSLLAANSGLSSRFPEEVIFYNMDPSNCVSLLVQELAKEKISIDGIGDWAGLAYTGFIRIFTSFSALPSWGNGRDVKTLAKALTALVFHDAKPNYTITAQAALARAQNMLDERQLRVRNLPTGLHPRSLSPPHPAYQQPPIPTASPAPSATISTSTAASSKHEKKKPAANTTSDGRDPGVSDDIWAAIQAAKKRKAEEEAEEKRLQQELEDHFKRLAAEKEKLRIRKLAIQKEKDDEQKRMRMEELRRWEEMARKKQEKLEAKRRAEEARIKEEKRKQEKLRNLGVCVQGFQWLKMLGGYRCAGGTHFVTDAQLQ